jgi:hypothetical protein
VQLALAAVEAHIRTNRGKDPLSAPGWDEAARAERALQQAQQVSALYSCRLNGHTCVTFAPSRGALWQRSSLCLTVCGCCTSALTGLPRGCHACGKARTPDARIMVFDAATPLP